MFLEEARVLSLLRNDALLRKEVPRTPLLFGSHREEAREIVNRWLTYFSSLLTDRREDNKRRTTMHHCNKFFRSLKLSLAKNAKLSLHLSKERLSAVHSFATASDW